ncbi:hypothetical protein ACTA71_005307 [Dictyostelium dimigraforme]
MYYQNNKFQNWGNAKLWPKKIIEDKFYNFIIGAINFIFQKLGLFDLSNYGSVEKLIVLLLYLNNFVSFGNDCKYNSPSTNQFFDLSPLKLNSDKYYTSNFVTTNYSKNLSTEVHFNFCNTQIDICDQIKNSTACQIVKDSKNYIYQLGSTLVNESYSFTSNGMKLTFKSTKSDGCTGNSTRVTDFIFRCNDTVESLEVWKKGEEVEQCKYEVYVESKLVCKSCTGCSSIHGSCDVYNGECICDSKTSGENCTTSKIFINTTSSTTIKGGSTTLNGYFGKVSTTTNDLEIKIGDLQCYNINVLNETTITCDIGPGEGIKNVTLIDGDLKFFGGQMFQYTYLCPNCSKTHGTCDITNGDCLCDSKSSGKDCTVLDIMLYSIDSTTINGGTTFLNGSFGKILTTNGLEIKIGDLQCYNIQVLNETTIKCDIGPGEGIKDVRLTDGDLLFIGNQMFQYTYLSCPNCLKLHSTCNVYTGDCICDSKTSGSNCSTSRIYINSIDSTTVNGGTTILNGYFGNSTTTTTTTTTIINNLSIKIGDLQCNNIIKSNETTIKCDIGPGEGIKDVILIDDDLSFIGKQLFQYTKIILSCPNNCTSPSNGLCNTATGVCSCFNGFTGINCNSKENSNTDIPSSKSNINETTGEATISNDGLNYQINIHSLVELNFNGTVINEFLLNNKWNNGIISQNDENSKIVTFSQKLINGSCEIEYSIEQVIGKNKDYSFAGINYSLPTGSLKLTVSIQNYTYQSTLNSIQLRINSQYGNTNVNNGSSGGGDCNSKKLDIDINDFKNDQSLNYLIISKDSKTFFGRFINKVISDGRETFMSTSIINQENDSIYIGLNLPHCTKSCLIDPDFSLLVDTDFKTSCDHDNSRPKWFLPVVIVSSAVGAAIIIIIGSIVYKRNRVSIRIVKDLIKLKTNKK